MTTVKQRALACFLILCFLILCFLTLSSCQTETIGLSGMPELSGESEDNGTAETDFSYNCVILPTTASDALVSRARALTDSLAERTGLPSSLYFESDVFLIREHTRLILLGNLDHALSQVHLHELRRDDYLCRLDSGHLILGGKSDAATVAALDRFTETLLPYANEELLINADQQFLVTATYAVTEAILNGYSLGNYRIVYPQNAQNGEKRIASLLREALADHCGWYPDLLPDDQITEPARIIAVGPCFGQAPTAEAQISVTNSGIFLLGMSEYALAHVAQAFCNTIFPAEVSGQVTVTLEESIAIPTPSPTLRTFVGVMAKQSPSDTVTAVSSLCSSLRNAAAPIAPFGRVTEEAFYYLQATLSDYAVLTVTDREGQRLPLFYREDTITVLEQSTFAHFLRIRFQVKESGSCFTLLYGYADNKEEHEQLLATASQAALPNELTLLFLSVPSPLTSDATNTPTFRGPYTVSREENHVQMFVWLPNDLSSSEILIDDTLPLYTFSFAHPFLTS